ncbi:hypothetical protein ACPDHQ_16920 [Myroides odoratimimus]|uniref:hypothetical protein n=1 Tax=Myroides odoratimimus TaxID=76832 RepID=UPI003D2F6CAE
MIYIVLIIAAITMLYIFNLEAKGVIGDTSRSTQKGVKNKYQILINLIMSRNSFYQLKEMSINNIEITNTGMVFKLIEIDKKLQITWHWNSFGSGRKYKLQWYFGENENQDKMYEEINKGLTIQTFIDNGMTMQQAKDWFTISKSNKEEEQDKLVQQFSEKYPELWSKIMG